MTWSSIQNVADNKVLHLTTLGCRTRLPRKIEIWFVVHNGRFYLFVETGEAAAWVKNLRRNPAVTVRIGEPRIGATARVLDCEVDRELWDQVAAIADRIWMGRRAAGGNYPHCATHSRSRYYSQP
jgi:deazaflavin-dependent oxidoreductase (nitroreductase family)